MQFVQGLLIQRWLGTISRERIEKYAKSFPINRLGDPEEIAVLALFLATKNSSYITGTSIDINGGDLMI